MNESPCIIINPATVAENVMRVTITAIVATFVVVLLVDKLAMYISFASLCLGYYLCALHHATTLAVDKMLLAANADAFKSELKESLNLTILTIVLYTVWVIAYLLQHVWGYDGLKIIANSTELLLTFYTFLLARGMYLRSNMIIKCCQ